MIYAEAFPNEKLPCFIEGCVHAVSFYGAVAKHFVPDNLKTAVTKHTKDDLVLQSTFSDLEDFYDTIVLPPPARKPKGKPTVENHVRYLETHPIEKLKEKIYTSFEDLNADIKKIVAVLNARPFQNQAFSRQEMFIKYDKPCMKPLPGGEYTTCDYKAVLKVPNNYHMPQRANTDLRQSRYRDFYKKNLTLGKAIINEIPVVTENIEDYLEKRHQELIEDNS